jgi:hypothetical protein
MKANADEVTTEFLERGLHPKMFPFEIISRKLCPIYGMTQHYLYCECCNDTRLSPNCTLLFSLSHQFESLITSAQTIGINNISTGIKR